MNLVFTVALFAVVLLAPLLARREQRWLECDSAEGRAGTRSRAYTSTIATQWVTTGALFVIWLFTTVDYRVVFLAPGWSGPQWLAVAAGMMAGGLMIAQTLVLRGRKDRLAEIRDSLGTSEWIAPRTPRERRLFDVLSLTAGVCEELVYRGFLLGTLAAWIGLWPAVAVSAVVFGLAHAYQGAGGVLRTGAFGAVAALLTVFSGSIYLVVVVHMIVDLSQGRMFAMAFEKSTPAEIENRSVACPH